MNYIYFIWLPSTKNIDLSSGAGSYIGQGTGEPYERMLDHLRIAYGSQAGPLYGAEKLIRDVGASGVMFGVYDAPNFGIKPIIYQQMIDEGWEIKDDAQKLDAAEILHIISHNGDLSGGNIATGGQGNLVWKLQDSSWVKKFETEFNLHKNDYSTDNINEVRIYWRDSREVALKKLLNPEKFLILRACSFVIQKEIFKNRDFLEKIVKKYFKNDNIQTDINNKINEIVNIINNKVFETNKISSNDTEGLIQITMEKLLSWIEERTKVNAINQLMDSFKENKTKIISYTVHGVPGFNRKTNTKNIVYKKDLSIKRKDLVKYMPNTQPKWYKTLMQNVPPIPKKHTSGREENIGSELNTAVSNCIYQIFKHYLNIATAGNTNVKPSVTLRERMESLYKEHGIKIWRFYDFYEIAITKWRKEKNRNLLKGEFNPEEERYLVTFQPEFTEDSYNYLWSEEYINEIENIDGNIIPPYLW